MYFLKPTAKLLKTSDIAKFYQNIFSTIAEVIYKSAQHTVRQLFAI